MGAPFRALEIIYGVQFLDTHAVDVFVRVQFIEKLQ